MERSCEKYNKILTITLIIVAILDGTSGRSFLLWNWDYWTGIIVSLPDSCVPCCYGLIYEHKRINLLL